MNGLTWRKYAADQTVVETQNTARSAGAIIKTIEKSGLPIFLFGAIFFISSLGFKILLSPDRFPVRLPDRTVRIGDLVDEEKALRDREARLRETKAMLDQANRSPVLHKVSKIKEDRLAVGDALSRVDEIRRTFIYGGIDPISLPGVEFQGDAGIVVVSGEVRDTGNRSQDILTRFIDGLRNAGLRVSEPEYLQNSDPDGGTRSPFKISIYLKND
ncbi:hypothetical protein A3A67_01145 [Candidatus Peribacteria bacterium RIFCSPLOWO2_01_FULL_51_18]|nr:MAG: hypothetical protein A3C52_02395 [Candidatus Peribacteria bacterium RIFCSPHIGHO2_02_FULL_51_15]OGJ65453.1 MAG: hypothetical protein A3A67_01145 [Candidatus Peribacteria bacterium RIFCSPLOWO2_01_FULL_51_18]OGJ69119.1 MAG: hypothetical protein A3J34_04020 [Candidatus Peribacteria bacterium RIFCSPLOWO2_02_FULL_51_10]